LIETLIGDIIRLIFITYMENYMSRHHSFVKINQAILAIENNIKFSNLYDYQDSESIPVFLKKKLLAQDLSEGELTLARSAIETYAEQLNHNNYHLVLTGFEFAALTRVETIFLKESFRKMNQDLDVDFPAFSLEEESLKNMVIVTIPETMIDNHRLRKVV